MKENMKKYDEDIVQEQDAEHSAEKLDESCMENVTGGIMKRQTFWYYCLNPDCGHSFSEKGYSADKNKKCPKCGGYASERRYVR